MPLRLGPLEAPLDPDLLGPHSAQLLPLVTRPCLVLHRASAVYTARTCLLLLFDLGWETRLRQGVTLDDLCADAPTQVRKPFAWMLPFLVAEGLLSRTGDRYVLAGEPDLELQGIRAAVEEEAPGHAANFNLLDGVRTRIPPFFTQGKAGEDLLFGLTVFPLWLAYFRNENLCYLPNNLVALVALQEGLAPGSRVLELGGGAGSFAQLVAQQGGLAGWLPKVAEYQFTDVAPAFLRRAQRELRALTPGLPLSIKGLDLNAPLGDQGVEPASLDVIVGVNVLHVAQNLEASLRELRRALKADGRLIIGECVKGDLATPLYLEFLFTFLRSFTDVDLDPQWRPQHGFLDPETWERALLHAGFSRVSFIPPPRPLLDACAIFNASGITAWV